MKRRMFAQSLSTKKYECGNCRNFDKDINFKYKATNKTVISKCPVTRSIYRNNGMSL